jgi:agmatinase
MLAAVTAIDPEARWAETGKLKPEYAGLLSFAEVPYTESAASLAGVDVAIVGAPMDELASDLPGARLGPRAIRAAVGSLGPHLDAGIRPLDLLKVVDYGDAPVVPADPVASHEAIERTVGEVVDAGAVPIVLGGDHSVAEPDIRACAERSGPVGLVHFDAHADTAKDVYGVEISHGTPMYRLVEQGHVTPKRYVQIGLRGYWPGPEEFAWQREQGITEISMRDVRERGIRDAVATAIETIGPGPAFASIDIDVLDPAFAPETGTPEPGGMTTADLLWACRELATELELVGADIVEVMPSPGGPNIAALVAKRIGFELITGMALRKTRG